MVRLFLIIVVAFVSCGEYTPKPAGFPRIERDESELVEFDYSDFSFSYPASVRIEKLEKVESGFWFNLEYPKIDATIYCTYLSVVEGNGKLSRFLDESYHSAYNHVSKADGIKQSQFSDSLHHTFGIIYDIKGRVASPIQFYVTDNEQHFLRGSFYFNKEVNSDSIKPIIQYVREDIVGVMETLRWKSKP